jgi:predicted GIY-YIG superfamily endonuclease
MAKKSSGAKSYSKKASVKTYQRKTSVSSKIQHKAGTYVIQNSATKEKYVGRSSNISKRVKQHNSGQGAKWTNIPVGKWNVVKTYAGNNNRTENAITKGVIRNEGFAHVRGGSYSKEYYPRDEFRAIKKANGFTNDGSAN